MHYEIFSYQSICILRVQAPHLLMTSDSESVILALILTG